MGRPPSQVGVTKKGPWTTQEDLLLVSYLEENGTRDWKSVPISTGLQRCSRSCRLRWKNYLRPGIKRGNFTADEDRKIINLQALLGNQWSVIAHYLPDRCDNDIKNYWHKCLKKMVNRAGIDMYIDDELDSNSTSTESHRDTDSSKEIWVKRIQNNVHTAKQALFDAISVSPVACSHHQGAATSPGLGSALAMGTSNTWNMNVNQQDLLITTNDFLCRNHAPETIEQASNCYINSHPCNIENIVQWLQRWTKESPDKESAEGNINIIMKNNSPVINHHGIMNNFGNDISVLSFISMENSMLPYGGNYIPPADAVAVPPSSSRASILGGEHGKVKD